MTKVEYYATDIECDSTSAERGRRWINMGVLCGDPGDESFSSEDFFFECGKDNHYDETTDDYRFSCSAQADIPRDSGGVIFPIPKVEAMTDYRWRTLSLDRCYTYKPASADASTSVGRNDGVRSAVEAATKSAAGGSRSLSTAATNTMAASGAPGFGLNCALPVMALFLAGVFL